MRIRCIFLIAMFSAPLFFFPALFADEFYSIITEIDPESARQIVELLLKTDIAECMQMARSIGEEEKPNISDLLTILCETNSKQDKNKVELILRILLESTFNRALDADSFNQRIFINKEGLDLLINKFNTFDDRLLRGKIISLIPLLHGKSYETLIQKEGFILIELLRKNNGYCSLSSEEEIFEILHAVIIIGSKDYLHLCVEIMNSTKNNKIHEYAKDIVKQLIHLQAQ